MATIKLTLRYRGIGVIQETRTLNNRALNSEYERLENKRNVFQKNIVKAKNE